MSCKKKIEYVYPETADTSACTWSDSKDFSLEQRKLLNLHAAPDRLVVGGEKYLSLLNIQGKIIDHYLVSQDGQHPQCKPALSDDLAAYLLPDNKTIIFISVKNPNLKRSIQISDIDSSQTSVYYRSIFYSRDPFLFINDSIHKIVFFGQSGSQPLYSMLDYTITTDSIYLTNLQRFPAPSVAFDFHTAKPWKDHFLISAGKGIFLLNGNGILIPSNYLNDQDMVINSFMEIRDTIYAYDDDQWKLIYSQDNLQWGTATSSFHPGNGTYFSINNHITYTSGNLLGALSINYEKGTYDQKQLCNKGLEIAAISDITLFGNAVYIASPTGLYYKPLSNFLLYSNP